MNPADLVRSMPLGTRVTVRYLLSAPVAARTGASVTDALGILESVDAERCTVQTRRGPVSIALVDVVAAKAVPPPSTRRAR